MLCPWHAICSPVVLDLVIRSSWQELRDFRPPVAQPSPRIRHDLLLLRTPRVLLDNRVFEEKKAVTKKKKHFRGKTTKAPQLCILNKIIARNVSPLRLLCGSTSFNADDS